MREMKDSGVAWLGDIDSRFDIKAIGNLFTIKKDIIGREPNQVLSITQRGIKIKDTTSNEGQNAASYAHYQIVNVGDFAMNHMDLLTGWVDISQYEGVTSPDYRVFTLSDNTQIPEYFLRVFQMYYSNRVFYAFGQGAANLGRWRLPRDNFVKIAIPCPPVELQRKIVDEIATKADTSSLLGRMLTGIGYITGSTMSHAVSIWMCSASLSQTHSLRSGRSMSNTTATKLRTSSTPAWNRRSPIRV